MSAVNTEFEPESIKSIVLYRTKRNTFNLKCFIQFTCTNSDGCHKEGDNFLNSLQKEGGYPERGGGFPQKTWSFNPGGNYDPARRAIVRNYWEYSFWRTADPSKPSYSWLGLVRCILYPPFLKFIKRRSKSKKIIWRRPLIPAAKFQVVNYFSKICIKGYSMLIHL